MQDVNIQELVKGTQGGDARCFEGIYQIFFDRIYRYILFKVGNVSEAEDLTGDVFVKVLESIQSFQWKGYPFSSWLFRIAHNLVVDVLRKRSRRESVPLEEVSKVSPLNVEEYVETRLTMEQLLKALEGLTKAQREVVSLRFVAGLSLEETARAVGRNENAVKALQHAGLLKMRRILAPLGDEFLSREMPKVTRERGDEATV